MILAMLIKNKKQGFSLLELLLTIAIFSVVSMGAGYLIIDATVTTDVNTKKISATLLAKEGLEAARSIRDDQGFDHLDIGSDNGVVFDETDNIWGFNGDSSDTSVDNLYTRVVSVDSVSGLGYIKKITSTVTAVSGLRNISVTLVTYLTDWR
jgi:prepilin-type N-terminal cleavage/methylation domain-containing protein